MTRKLPHSLEEALKEVEDEREWLEKTLGKDYVNWFLVLKRGELEKLGGMDVEERRKLLVNHF